MVKKAGVIAIISLFLIILSILVYAEIEIPTGTFNIANALPSAPFAWAPIITHNKSENFSWTQTADPNADPITTYVCITNDTDSDSCSVVDTLNPSNIFWYKFNQSESFWDYAWGTASRTYYVKLTPNDGTGNGTVNDAISFTLTDAIPTITGQTSDTSNDGDKDVGEVITFSMTSHADGDDPLDNHSLKVCLTNSINTSGGCPGGEVCNEHNNTFSDDASLACSYTAQQSDNTTIAAYFFVCDCPPSDQSCPGQCSISYSHTFYVNHAPNATLVDIKPDTPSSADDLNCSFNFTDIDLDGNGTSTYKWFNWSGGIWVETAFTGQILPDSGNTHNGETWMCEVTPVDEHGFAGKAVNSTNETIGNAAPDQPFNFSVQDGVSSYDLIHDPLIDTHDLTPFISWNVTDNDGDPVSMYVCVATSAADIAANICDANYSLVTDLNITLGGLFYNGTSMNYFVRLTPNDGSENGTYLDTNFTLTNNIPSTPTSLSPTRSEERRVGKECRSRWSPYH